MKNIIFSILGLFFLFPMGTIRPYRPCLSHEGLVCIDYYAESPIHRQQLLPVVQWMPEAQRVADELDDYRITPELLLAVIGAETGGIPGTYYDEQWTGGDGYSIGLMQLVPGDYGCRSWDNLNYPYENIKCGAVILQEIFNLAQQRIDNNNGIEDYNAVEIGLAAYNCGFESLYQENGKQCYYFGGLTYTDKVLNKWMLSILLYNR